MRSFHLLRKEHASFHNFCFIILPFEMCVELFLLGDRHGYDMMIVFKIYSIEVVSVRGMNKCFRRIFELDVASALLFFPLYILLKHFFGERESAIQCFFISIFP